MKALNKKSYFNRFFCEKSFKGGIDENRFGFAIFRKFYKPNESSYFNLKQRYLYIANPQSLRFILLLLPAWVSFALWIYLFLNLLILIFEGEYFFWWLLVVIPVYSILVLNFTGLFYDRLKYKGAYFDRINRRVSFTWNISNAEEFDDFGNPTFDWDNIECRIKNEFGALGIMKAFIEIRHKDFERYPNAKLTINASGDTSKPVQCFLEWESIVRHMEQDKPLPDTPEYELHRELDPITKSFDESNGRPKGFWTQFSLEQQREIEEQIFQEALKFDWSEGKVQPEITKPWEVWTPDPKRPPKPRGMFTMIMLQLVFCYPE
ncbi:hypothetical protein [Pseudoalteromonas piscicida]|uniref:hypothetical protein n=1 Tax=Pseudoalteromonas piscicida TaxID=43662 RepID=UPI0030ADFDC1